MNKNWDAEIKQMVDRFLAWRLPQPWNPDNGISYQRPNYAHPPTDSDWPTGTNLFDAAQAEAMVRHMLGLPAVPAEELSMAELEAEYARRIPACCSYRTLRDHMESLGLCWSLVSAVENNASMDCSGCDLAMPGVPTYSQSAEKRSYECDSR